MSMDDIDDVEIVLLHEGTVRIVLPSAISEHRHEGSGVGELPITRPLSLSSPVVVTPVLPPIQTKYSILSRIDIASNPESQASQETDCDRYVGCRSTAEKDILQSTTETQKLFPHRRGQILIDMTSEQKGKGENLGIDADKNYHESVTSGTGSSKKNGVPVEKRLRADYSSVPSTSVHSLASSCLSTRTNNNGMKTSEEQNHRKSAFTTMSHVEIPRTLTYDTNSSYFTVAVDPKKSDEPLYRFSRDRASHGSEVTTAQRFEQGENVESRKRLVNNQPDFVTTLPTGATRISVKQSCLQRESKPENLQIPETANVVECEDTKHSIDSPNDTTYPTESHGNTQQYVDSNNTLCSAVEDRGTVLSNLTFDCLEDVQVSSETEEQLAHFLLAADTSESESESLPHPNTHADWTEDSICDKVYSTINSEPRVLDLDINEDLHLNSDSFDHNHRTLHIAGKIPKDRRPPFTRFTSESGLFVPNPEGKTSPDRKTKWVDVKPTLAESEGSVRSRDVYAQGNSDSEYIFSGQTYSRAMWRSTSADASPLHPSFSSRTPLHKAFFRLERDYSGSTSSDEEWIQRSKNPSLFSRLRWAGRTSRKWADSKQVLKESKQERSHSAYIDNHERAVQVLGKSDHRNTERYLEAALALADSKRRKSKSSSVHSSAKVRQKDLKCESSNRYKHSQKKKTPAIEKASSCSLLISRTHPTAGTQDAFSELDTTERNCSPRADTNDLFNADALNGKETNKHAKHFSSVTAFPADSLTSSDSQRSACPTSEEKRETESTSSADSVHTVYFVPEKTAYMNSPSVICLANKSQMRRKTSQLTSPESHQPSSSVTDVSDMDDKGRKIKLQGLVAAQHQTMCTQDIAKDKDVIEKRSRTKQTIRHDIGRTLVTNEADKPKETEFEDISFGNRRRSSEVEKRNAADVTESDSAVNHNYSNPQSSMLDLKRHHEIPTVETDEETLKGASSLSGSSEPGSVSGSLHHKDSDTGQQTAMSTSSSNGLLTSESDIGPLVTFPKTTLWGAAAATASLSTEAPESGAESEHDTVTALELRRRYSSDEYVPASPFATLLRHQPSNLSEGARPLFLQRQRSLSRTGHARQLSLDIGEEWESVHSPNLHTLSMFPTPLQAEEDVFFGPSTSSEDRRVAQTSYGRSRAPTVREEYIPLPTMTSDITSKYSCLRKKSHQTSAKLRLLYPNPAEPRPVAMSEEQQREIMSTLTRTELSRLQQAGSPLLELLKSPKKDGADKVKRMRTKQDEVGDPSPPPAPDSATAERRTQNAPPPVQTFTSSLKPIVTVQPMPRAPQESDPAPRTDHRSGDVAIAMLPTDVQFDSLASLPLFKRRLLPNPYNRLNQRCHSGLQCPCCFFFCFFCCAPAVVFMRRSDYEFDYGSLHKARYYGRRTTALYVVGTVVAVCLFVASIVATVVFLQELLLRRRGWS